MTGQPFAITGYLVTQTYWVRHPRRPEGYYEIQLAVEESVPRLIFLTRDPALYDAALAIEGTPQRVDVAWKPGRRHDGKVAQVLCALRAHLEAA